MAPRLDRRATTLSVSVTPELASEVSRRVDSGLYSSASELFREALRLLLRSEGEVRSPAERRLDEALKLQEQALSLPRAASGISEQERRERIAGLSLERELHPGVRLASPERVERILRGPQPDGE